MANTQSMCTSFHGRAYARRASTRHCNHCVSRTSLTAPTTDTLKAALFLASATIDASTTAYSATGEVSGTGIPLAV
jgi:hypothetical protein